MKRFLPALQVNIIYASDTVHNSKAYFVLFLDAIASLEPGQRRSVTHSRIEIRSRAYLRIQG